MIDPDLYQMLTLGLLGLILIVALLTYSAVVGLRKSGGAPQAVESPAPTSVTSTAEYGVAPQAAAQTATPAAMQVTPAAQPVAAQPAAAQPAAAQPIAAAATPAVGGEPQDQPFERDGRWWFRRGTELLVYDERTGQWVAAPPEGTAAAAPAAAAPAVGTGTLAGEAVAGAFWKCPSCGAVNGATATTCRMCFTARP